MILQAIDNINFREYVLRSIEIQLRDKGRNYSYALEEKKMKILFSVRIKMYYYSYSNFKMIMQSYEIDKNY